MPRCLPQPPSGTDSRFRVAGACLLGETKTTSNLKYLQSKQMMKRVHQHRGAAAVGNHFLAPGCDFPEVAAVLVAG
jgi:hypothetical protein